MKKLQIDALNADLATVDALLASRSENDDPVGWLQLKVRREEIEHEIQSLQPFRESHASVGLFFGGRPVVGTRGIRADFHEIFDTIAGALDDRLLDSVKRFSQLDENNKMRSDVAGRLCSASLRVREIRQRNKESQFNYTLVKLERQTGGCS